MITQTAGLDINKRREDERKRRVRSRERKSGGGAGEKAVYMSADRIIVTKNRVMGTRGIHYALNTGRFGRDEGNTEKRLSVANARGIIVENISISNTLWRNACTGGRRHYPDPYLSINDARDQCGLRARWERRENNVQRRRDKNDNIFFSFLSLPLQPSLYGLLYSRL